MKFAQSRGNYTDRHFFNNELQEMNSEVGKAGKDSNNPSYKQ